MTQFHITSAEMRALRELIREIPGLVEDLAIALTRQSRISGGPRVDSGTDEQPLPYDIGASDAHDLLNQTLTDWASLVYAGAFTHPRGFIGPLHPHERRRPTLPGTTTLAVARWLERHITSLARVSGAEDAYDEISHAMQRCRNACDQHDDRAVIPIDDTKVDKARDEELHAAEIEIAARKIGGEWANLTARRVRTLAKAERIHAIRCVVATRAEIYVLGEVLDAHLVHPARTVAG
ncbi:hypothetical protein [Rhodococcus sp. NPDC127528]|uniref:hypothetical protein n=1 Tax=unclassified Rhodococcus (in: high G+C Gram-positive bacteria) TaxID=192944 RepID=UPI003642668B